MKFYLFLAFAFVAGFVSAQDGAVHFTVKNPPSSDCVIGYYLGAKKYIVGEENAAGVTENVALKLNDKGEGTFYKKDMEPGVYLLVFQPQSEFLEFIYEGKTQHIEVDMKDVHRTAKSDNTSNTLMFARNLFLTGIQTRQDAIDARAAQNPADEQLKIDQIALGLEVDEYDLEMQAKHPDNLFVRMIAAMKEPEIPASITEENARFFYYRAHFFDRMPLDESWMLRTPVYEGRIDRYINDLTYQVPDSLIAAWDYLIARSASNPEMYKYLLIKGLNTYAMSKLVGQDAVYVHFLEHYYFTGKAYWMDAASLQPMKDGYEYLKQNLLGMKAPDITGKTSEGKSFQLRKVEADRILLFFVDEADALGRKMESEWMSLREKIPSDAKLIAVYKDLDPAKLKQLKQDKGYFWDMISVSEETWKALSFAYDLRSTPKLYVLDAQQDILIKKINPETALNNLFPEGR